VIARRGAVIDMLRRINISLAFIVLVCFFLPWEQVSCGGAQDTLSGFDLARHDHVSLWLVPLGMLAVLVFALVRRRQPNLRLLAIVSLLSAAVSAYLLNDERGRVRDAAGIITAQLTGWFWLALISAVAMIAGAIGMFLKRDRAT